MSALTENELVAVIETITRSNLLMETDDERRDLAATLATSLVTTGWDLRPSHRSNIDLVGHGVTLADGTVRVRIDRVGNDLRAGIPITLIDGAERFPGFVISVAATARRDGPHISTLLLQPFEDSGAPAPPPFAEAESSAPDWLSDIVVSGRVHSRATRTVTRECWHLASPGRLDAVGTGDLSFADLAAIADALPLGSLFVTSPLNSSDMIESDVADEYEHLENLAYAANWLVTPRTIRLVGRHGPFSRTRTSVLGGRFHKGKFQPAPPATFGVVGTDELLAMLMLIEPWGPDTVI